MTPREPNMTINAPNARVVYPADSLPAVHAGRRLIRVRLEDLQRVFRPVPSVYTRARRRAS